MGDLEKLRIAVWQRELRDDSPRADRAELDGMVRLANEKGADCLVAFGAKQDGAPEVIPCNTATSECGDARVMLETAAGVYTIGLNGAAEDCDLAVMSEGESWTVGAQPRAALASGVPSIIVNGVGMGNAGHSVRCYDGGSAVFDAEGKMICTLRDDFEEDFRLLPMAADSAFAEPCEHKLLHALSTTIRRFDRSVLGGSSRWIIGLSGGLDSSVTAALLVHALGCDRVVGYNLPSGFNSQATKDNAAILASALGIAFRNAQIGDVVEATGRTVESAGYAGDAVSGLVLENVQARVRGHLLCTFAAVEGGVVVNNANFVEAALGYSTLYGDSVGALAPIGDLTKTELFGLAHDINAAFGGAVIPENLLPRETAEGYIWETMPSAELADGQRDPMKWFYHDWLVRKLAGNADEGAADVIAAYCEDRLEAAGMAKWVRFYGLDDPKAFIGDLEWVLRQMCGAAYKRIQAAPAILVHSERAPFGESEVQRRWEPTERYSELRSRLLGE